MVLSAGELDSLQDRLFQLRCAAEDVATAAGEGARPQEVHALAQRLLDSARDLERIR